MRQSTARRRAEWATTVRGYIAADIARRTGMPLSEVEEALAAGRSAEELLELAP